MSDSNVALICLILIVIQSCCTKDELRYLNKNLYEIECKLDQIKGKL